MSDQNENAGSPATPPVEAPPVHVGDEATRPLGDEDKQVPIEESGSASGDERPVEIAHESTTETQQQLGINFPPYEDSDTVMQERPTETPLSKLSAQQKQQLRSIPPMSLPADLDARIEELLEAMPNVDWTKYPGGVEWNQHLRASIMTSTFEDTYLRSLGRDGAKYRQIVPSEAGGLAGGQPIIGQQGSGNYTGEKAVMRVEALLGRGSLFSVPLWHSGFWITLRAPAEADLIALHERLDQTKVELGRQSYGHALSNYLVYYAEMVVEFALSHLYETTLEAKEVPNIRKHIKIQDVNLIAWGLTAAIYPQGFPFVRSIVNSAGEKFRTVTAMLNINRLLWTDTAALTDRQRAHMARRRAGQHNAAELQAYVSQFLQGQDRQVVLDEVSGIKITMTTPSYEDYITSGHKWVDSVVKQADEVFAQPPSDAARNQYILSSSRATYLRQYAHWVRSIDLDDGDGKEDDGKITHRQTIDDTLDRMSAHDVVRDTLIQKVREYLEDATVAVVAIPTVEGEHKEGFRQFPHLIPLDALTVFFIQLVQRVKTVTAR